MTQQDAYVELSKILETAEALMTQARSLAREHMLLFEQRYLDSLPETLDPSRYHIEKKPSTLARSGFSEAAIFNDDDAEYPGQRVFESWVPSQLC